MTVAELIMLLNEMPRDHEVVVDLHSEYCIAAAPKLIVGADNGGYVSEPRNVTDKSKVHGYVHIGPKYGGE